MFDYKGVGVALVLKTINLASSLHEKNKTCFNRTTECSTTRNLLDYNRGRTGTYKNYVLYCISNRYNNFFVKIDECQGQTFWMRKFEQKSN